MFNPHSKWADGYNMEHESIRKSLLDSCQLKWRYKIRYNGIQSELHDSRGEIQNLVAHVRFIHLFK